MTKKIKVLVLCTYYLPAFKAGGPIRTISNMVESMAEMAEFYILANDRDLGDPKPFDNIICHKWTFIKKAKVYYLEPGRLSFRRIKSVINSQSFDVIYLNSFFSPKYALTSLLCKKLGFISDIPFIIAPRGAFSYGHLKLKPIKYKLYILFLRILSLCRDVTWQASSAYEKEDILKWFPDESSIVIAPNLPSPNLPPFIQLKKKEGELKLIFLSRISPKKNLDGALNLLKEIDGNIELTIIGPLGNSKYWKKCKSIIEQMPSNIKVVYSGQIEHDKVNYEFQKNHFFFFPTLGENYGHVIFESLSAGCPVLISDQTPWRNLKKKNIGWDIPLDDVQGFKKVLQSCVEMENFKYQKMAKDAYSFCENYLQDNTHLRMNKALFEIFKKRA